MQIKNMDSFGNIKTKNIALSFATFDFPAEDLVSLMNQLTQEYGILSCRLVKDRSNSVQFLIVVREDDYAVVMVEITTLISQCIGHDIVKIHS